MALYFFDIHDGTMTFDREGTEYASVQDARQAAKRLLPDMARDEVPYDGDRHTFAVMVSDEDRRPVYTATLSFTGLMLIP